MTLAQACPLSVESVLQRCQTENIRLWVEADRLEIAAPGPIEADLLAELRHHKPAIIARLSQLHPNPFPTSEPLRFEPAEVLTYLQRVGIALRVEAGQLHWRDPDPSIECPGLEEAMTQYGPALVDLILEQANATAPGGVHYDRGSVIVDRPAFIRPKPTTTF